MNTQVARQAFEQIMLAVEASQVELGISEKLLAADYDKRLAEATKDLRNNAAIRATQLADANKQVVELTAKVGSLQVLLKDEQARTRSANEQLLKRTKRVNDFEVELVTRNLPAEVPA